MKQIIAAFAFLFWVGGILQAQDTIQHDNYLRMNMTLIDSIGIDYHFLDGSVKTLYKFKTRKSSYGIYNYVYIYVATYGEDIYQFNPLKNTGVDYWWTLMDTKEYYMGIPIYRHSGNF